MTPEVAMILAAGFGTRMGALTQATPKPLLEVSGRALIDHALAHIEAAGIARAVVNLHYRGDQIRAHLADRAAPEILFSEELPEILDTGGGLRHALPLLGDAPFAALNSDAVFVGENPLDRLTEIWDAARMDILMLMIPQSRARAYSRPGDFFLDFEGHAPQRRGDAPTAPMIYAGAQIVDPAVFDQTPEGAFSMNLVWDRALAVGRLAACTYSGLWVDVGTPEGLDAAGRALASA